LIYYLRRYKPEKNLKTEQLVPPASFCWTERRRDYGRVNAGNLRKFGFTRKGRQRWQCATCDRVFAETRGTVFQGKRHDEQTILKCLAMLAEGNSLAAIDRIKWIKEGMAPAWLVEGAAHSAQIEERLTRDYKLSRAQTRRPVNLRRSQGRKRRRSEEPDRGTAIETEIRRRATSAAVDFSLVL
jgi:transposase-like protein